MEPDESDAREGMHSVTRGTLTLLLGTLVFVAANFVARVILVRSLSTTEFSEFYIALTLSGLLTAFGQLGLPQAVARSIPYAAGPTEQRGIVHAGFRLTIPLAVGAAAALFVLSIPISLQYHAPLLGVTLQFFAVSVVTLIIAGMVAAVFQGFEDVRPNTLFNQVLTPVLFIVFLVVFATSGPGRFPLGYEGALVAYVLSNVLSFVGIATYYLRRLPRALPAGPSDPAALRKVLGFAMPLFFAAIFSFLAGAGDTLLLGFYHNAEAGPYGAALSLARLELIGVGSLSYILLPVVARFVRAGQPSTARIVYATATKWTILTSLPIVLVFFVFPAPSLTFVYKAAYAQTTTPLQLLVVGAFISTVIGPAAAAQVSFGQTRLILYNNLAAAAVDVGLGFALIPTYGIVGAAVAWATATALGPTLSVVELAVSHGFHPFLRHYLVALGATALPVAAVLALVPFHPALWMLPLLVVGIGAVYIAVTILTRSIDRGDRLLLEAVERLIGRPVPGARWVARRFPPGG